MLRILLPPCRLGLPGLKAPARRFAKSGANAVGLVLTLLLRQPVDLVEALEAVHDRLIFSVWRRFPVQVLRGQRILLQPAHEVAP
jgi:hypothetical protein